MARLLSPPALHPLFKRASTEAAQPEKTVQRASASVSIAHVWRESLQTFSTHSIAMLMCILFGLSSPFLVGHWIATQTVLQNMAWVGPVPTLQERLPALTMITITLVAMVTSTLSQAIITLITLQSDRKPYLHWIIVKFPFLLSGQLVWGAIASLLILSTAAPVWNADVAFQEVQVAPLWTQTETKLGILTRKLAWQGLGSLVPNPGTAFGVLISEARTNILRKEPATEYEKWLIENTLQLAMQQSSVGQLQSMRPGLLGLTSISCLVLLVVAEILLRFRIVLVLEPPEAKPTVMVKSGGERLQRFAALASLIDSARFGLRHFGAITLHSTVLRITGFALVLLCVALPTMATTQFVMPAMVSLIGKTPLLPWMYFAQVSGAVIVAGILQAFSTIYDTKLFKALSACGG